MAVLVETTIGDFVIDLYIEERPKSSLNFIKLCKMKYYNYCLFQNVERNFIAQTGDPNDDGGESIWGLIKGKEYKYFEAELVPRLKHKKVGTVAMVNNETNCVASQFYITLREDVDYLDGKHTIFGELAESEGLEVIQKLNETYCDKNGRPLQDIRILHTVVLDDPFDDLEGFNPPSRSPSPPLLPADAEHIAADENINDLDGKTEKEIEEMIENREQKANANILEMVGDIPDADGKPPENVLFVCKLNPATTGEDLEIIFSRFGPIVSCEVIKDMKTGDSLQYAFIEFENEEDCVSAYFKMDNVLIDDRRIHVDFSQSMAKVKPTKRRFTSDGDGRSDAVDHSSKEGKYSMVFDDETLVQSGSKETMNKTLKKYRSSDKGGNETRRYRSRSPERVRRHRNDYHRSKSRERRVRRDKSSERKHHRRREDRSRSRGRRSRSREDRRKYRRRSRSKDRNKHY